MAQTIHTHTHTHIYIYIYYFFIFADSTLKLLKAANFKYSTERFFFIVYIRIPTRCTDSCNLSLFIIKCSTCFGLFSPSPVAIYSSKNVAPDDGLIQSEHVEHLMIKKDTF